MAQLGKNGDGVRNPWAHLKGYLVVLAASPVILLGPTACQRLPVRQMPHLLGAPPRPPHTESALLGSPDLRADSIGYLVWDLEAEKAAKLHNPSVPFMPASVAKIPTTLAALQILGTEHRFETRLLTPGRIRASTVSGDVYLKGEGDPLLTVGGLMELVQELKAKGIGRVEGRFFYDESALPHRSAVDPAFPSYEAYNPGLSALSVDFNRMVLVGDRDEGHHYSYLLPSVPSVELALAPRGLLPSPTLPEEREGGLVWELSDQFKRRGRHDLPVPDPGRFAAELFRSLCAMEGIALPSPVPGRAPANARTLAVHRGETTASLVDRTLEYSNNVMAELLMLAAAAKLAGHPIDAARSAEILEQWWRKKLPKLPWKGYRNPNGSGLSTEAQITPEQMVGFLRYARGTRPLYLPHLPISGWKGTLRQRLDDPDHALRVWAKTGTIDFGLGLAGYFYARSGKKYVFALFANDREKRQAFEQQRAERPTLPLPPDLDPDPWIDRLRAVQDGFLVQWIDTL